MKELIFGNCLYDDLYNSDSKDEWISGYVEIVLDEMVFCVKDPAPNTSN
jgi:hypothetical protein